MTEDDDSDASFATLAAIPSGLSSRARATGRIAWRVGLRSAARLVGRQKGADERLGELLLGELDHLKGMAMKVGQILSYMDVGFPEEVTTQLARLRTGVTPMPPEQIIAEIESSLGRPLDECFACFTRRPIAAASIGQVHRATTHEGDAVAVKVRYPNIQSTLQGDFAQIERLGGLAGTFTAVDGRALVAELFERIVEECDYQKEAGWQRRFASFFEEDADITVPAVYDALSADAVLTTAWCGGATFEDFCATASPEARDRASAALLRFAFAPFFGRGWLHADPHPGNQIYGADGTIVALDFGCVRAFEEAFVRRYATLCRAVFADDAAAFREVAIELGLAPRPDRVDFDELGQQYAWLFAPVRTARFELSNEWWKEGQRFTKPTAKNARHVGFPPEQIWMLRVQWGLWAVLKRIGGRADLRSVFAELLEGVDA